MNKFKKLALPLFAFVTVPFSALASCPSEQCGALVNVPVYTSPEQLEQLVREMVGPEVPIDGMLEILESGKRESGKSSYIFVTGDTTSTPTGRDGCLDPKANLQEKLNNIYREMFPNGEVLNAGCWQP